MSQIPPMSRLHRLTRRPKLQIIAVLVLLAIIAMSRQPTLRWDMLLQFAMALAVAFFAECAFFGNVNVSGIESAAVTGSLVAMILAPGVELPVVWFAATAAVGSKKLLERIPGRHIFNPAAFGLFLAAILFGNRLNWWGYSSSYVVIMAAGIVLFRLKRLSLPFSYLLFRALSAAVTGNAAWGAEAMLTGNMFFAFIMVVEPKTSPGKRSAQWFFGGVAGILATLFYQVVPTLEGDLAALLAVNFMKPWLERFPYHRQMQTSQEVG